MEIKVADQSYDLSRLTIVEAEAIEKVTGQKMQDALGSGTAASLRALVWVAMKRQEPTLRYTDVDFALEDVEVVTDDEEAEGADPTTPPSADTDA
jgi:hypothetical protein